MLCKCILFFLSVFPSSVLPSRTRLFKIDKTNFRHVSFLLGHELRKVQKSFPVDFVFVVDVVIFVADGVVVHVVVRVVERPRTAMV